MSSNSSEAKCPNCARRIAAWKKDHCVYCGAPFPPDFKQGFAEPEARRFFGKEPKLAPETVAEFLTPWPAQRAERRFLARFKALNLE